MTEKEKMIAGKAYLAYGEELTSERMRAKELVYRFNNLPPAEQEEKNSILLRLFGELGDGFWIEAPFRCDYGYNIHAGKNLYINYNCVILDCSPVTIGDNVMFGPNVSLFAAGHPVHPQPRTAGWEYGRPIAIGSRVWIGGNTVINPGVTIGENSVIGAGSVVTKDIPANVIAVGNPCRVLRPITEEDKQYYYKKLLLETE